MSKAGFIISFNNYLILSSPLSSLKPVSSFCYNNNTERKYVIPKENISDFSGFKFTSLTKLLYIFFNSGDI